MSNWKDRIRNPDCELCPLHEEAEHVCLMGAGSRKSKIMIVGEAPGEREDETHKAFVGPAGQLLTELLKIVGISRKECYITNAAKCRPPSNRTPDRKEIKVCSQTYLFREWDKVSPEFVLALGNSALQAILGKSGITKHRGTPTTVRGSTVFPTFHPAAALRNPKYSSSLRADIQRFAALVRGEDSGGQPTSTKLVRTPQALKALRRVLMRAEEISFDIETTQLEEWDEGAEIVSIAFSWKEGHGAFVPIYHKSTNRRWADAALRYLKPVLERPDAKYIGHNGKFDCKWLASKGVNAQLTFDTMLAAHILDENRLKGLKPLSQILLGVHAYDVGDDIKDAYNMPLRRLAVYNVKDTDYTLRLYHRFKAELKEQPRLARVFAKLMMPASNTLTKVEVEGIWVDKKRLRKMTIKAGEEREKVMKKLLKYVPKKKRATINFNSPQQLGKWLFGDLGLNPIKKTKSGKSDSTDESVMLALAKDHPAPQLLLKYRMWTKRLNTYLGPWEEKRDKRSRIHTTYKLFGTVTGRLSSVEPNLQQVPRESTMRTVFGAPPGWVFVKGDYSQIELRIIAMLANERTMLRAFLTGEDIHLKTACEMSGLAPARVSKEQRKKAKPVNFGFSYGMGAKRLVSYAFEDYGVEMTLGEAEAYRSRFFQTYQALPAWHNRQRRLVHRYHQVQSPIGRVRHLPDVLSRDPKVQAEAERQAINSPVQSFASDLMLLSMVQLDAKFRSTEARVVGTVHDELLFIIREGREDIWLPIIKDTMEDMDLVRRKLGAEVTVPIVAELEIGTHWGNGSEWVPSSS